MPFDYESLVGHLYIVNGRALSMMPPGALVEVAPKKAARGREADTFYALVLPSGDAAGPAAFYEQMAQLAADQYYASTGSVTAGLRAVLELLNQNLTQHNKSGKKRYEASMVIAALRGSDLYVGKVGSAVLALHTGAGLVTYPDDLTDDDAVFRPPLGVHAVPDIRLTRYNVVLGSRVLLADASLGEIDRATLDHALKASDLGAVLVTLKESAPREVIALAIEFVPPEAATPTPPAAVPVTDPVAVPDPVLDPPPVIHAGESTSAIAASLRPPKPPPAPETPSEPETPRSRRRQRENRIQKQIQETAGDTALKAADAVDKGKEVFEHYFPAEGSRSRSFFTSPLAGVVALLIPVVVVGLVLTLWLGGTGESEFELCVIDAQEAASTARGINSADVIGYRAAWNATLTIVERCLTMRADDPTLADLRVEGQQVIDALDQVTRREPTRIMSYEQATLTSIVVQGLELYVLDDANNQVYRLPLNSDGRSASNTNPLAIAAMRRNAQVNGFAVNDLVDIAWAELGGGTSTGRVITALDTDGTLVSCTPRFLDCSAEQLASFELIQTPRAYTIWDRNGALYILDPDSDQIWRYVQTGGSYVNPPDEYFTAARPELANAVDLAIDEDGLVYILMADGTGQRYNAGTAQSFAFVNFPGEGMPSGTNAMFLSTDPMALVLFFTNRERRAVYQTTYVGTWWSTYRAYDETQFQSLGGIAADIGTQTIYVTSGNTIFAIPRQ